MFRSQCIDLLEGCLCVHKRCLPLPVQKSALSKIPDELWSSLKTGLCGWYQGQDLKSGK